VGIAEHKGERFSQEARIGMAIIIAVLTLPAVRPELAGWMTGLVPLPIFYYLIYLGKRKGIILIRNSILFSSCIAFLFGSLPLLLFSLTLIPLGFVFFQAAQNRTTPAQAGLTGFLVLVTVWLFFWTIYGMIQHINPYKELLSSLDNGLTAAFNLYQETTELPADTRRDIGIAIEQLRVHVPRILPGILITGLLYTVWANQVLGNWLLKKRGHRLAPWRDFKEWQLPENLVWGCIFGGGAILFSSGALETIGLNILIVLGALYCLQGLAVLVSQLTKWSIPLPLRAVVYAFIVVQTFGIILLAFIGLVDVWADFRKLNKPRQNQPDNQQDIT